jgi:hypothetical protein
MIQNYLETDPDFVSELFQILDEMESTLKLYLQKGQLDGTCAEADLLMIRCAHS